jgi:hypothetical protein
LRFDSGRLLGIGTVVGAVAGVLIGHARAGTGGAVLGVMVGPPVVWLILSGPRMTWELLGKYWWLALLVGTCAYVLLAR